jgi:hypothetical protein
MHISPGKLEERFTIGALRLRRKTFIPRSGLSIPGFFRKRGIQKIL